MIYVLELVKLCYVLMWGAGDWEKHELKCLQCLKKSTDCIYSYDLDFTQCLLLLKYKDCSDDSKCLISSALGLQCWLFDCHSGPMEHT